MHGRRVTTEAGSGVQPERDMVPQRQGTPSSVLEELVCQALREAGAQHCCRPDSPNLGFASICVPAAACPNSISAEPAGSNYNGATLLVACCYA